MTTATNSVPTDLLKAFEAKQLAALQEQVTHPQFKAGDTLKVTINIEEGGKKWTQTAEGICIACTSKGVASSFVIRRLEGNGAIKMRFPLYGKGINIQVLKRGKVRRAKLYYLEHCSRKAGRIKEIAPSKAKAMQNKIENKG